MLKRKRTIDSASSRVETGTRVTLRTLGLLIQVINKQRSKQTSSLLRPCYSKCGPHIGSASSGSLLEMETIRPILDLLIDFNKVPM